MKLNVRTVGVGIVAMLVATIAPPATPALADNIRNQQWHLNYLDVKQANQITKGTGVVVGVVDSGVEPHSDIRKNVLEGGNVQPTGDPTGRTDPIGHGTEM